ncbi:acyl-CoA dehydrogenase family protein [Goekera deserti]|uniref:acyl-CoA dehydrogenase family protein n=1 Tax=Goekera deserti TaxID=2497753 RepID=UPI001F459208|nr:acyl-CoA dehydrogenase family protein [Goekera deserti]
MSDDQDLVRQTVREVLTAHPPVSLTAELTWDEGLWAELAAAGLTGVGLPEEAGGSGGEVADAVAVVGELARGAGAVPVGEQLLVAGPAVLAAGLQLPPPDEPLVAAVDGDLTAVPDGDGWLLSGTAVDVPWAGVALHLAVLAQGPDGPVLALVRAPAPAWTHANLAGEPRGSVAFDGLRAPAAPITVAAVADLRARAALLRAVQLAAALEQVLALTLRYAGEREQFGRPLGKFQAIQMYLAEMAGEVTAVTAVVDAAVQALEAGEPLVPAAATAKVRAGAAVEVVAALAHQVHGAIGFTQEHALHHLTRRCWAWRDEAGSELAWSATLGEHLVAGGADGFWPALTRVV